MTKFGLVSWQTGWVLPVHLHSSAEQGLIPHILWEMLPKAPKRPFWGENHRAALIAAIKTSAVKPEAHFAFLPEIPKGKPCFSAGFI